MPITYSVGGFDGSQLLRTVGGNQRIVANNIVFLRARRFADRPDVVELRIKSQRTNRDAPLVEGELYLKVNLRN